MVLLTSSADSTVTASEKSDTVGCTSFFESAVDSMYA